MKKIENLKNVKRVRFNDYSEYEPGKSSNGGHYGFWADYTITENGEWEVSYGTTADFEFCPVCGIFGNHEEWDEEAQEYFYSCGSFSRITEEKLLELINEFHETDGHWIEYK